MKTKSATMIQRITFVFSRRKILPFLILLLLSFSVSAQRDEEVESLEFGGTTFLDGKKLKGATVTLYKDNVKSKEKLTGSNGKFTFNLSYGSDYKITFSYPGCIDMHIVVFAKIPKKKYVYNIVYRMDVLFYNTDDKIVDISKYKYPFTKVIFNDKNNMFTDDLIYMNEFKQGVFNKTE